MKLLLIHRYTWPDAPPYAHFLLAMARRFVRDGHQVTVLGTQPSYLESSRRRRRPSWEDVDGVRILRMSLLPEKKRETLRRVANTLVFLARVFAHLCRNRYDLVTFSTMPPVALGLTVRIALIATGRDGRYLYHCQDIYPELAVTARLMREGWLYRLLRRLDIWTCRGAGAVVVLSRDMRATLADRGVDEGSIRVINNFSLVEEVRDRAAPEGLEREPDDFVVLFAGNIGRFQNLDTVIEAARRLRDQRRLRFWFVGDGAARKALEEQAGDLVTNTVWFVPRQEPEAAFAIMQASDLGLVTLNPGLVRVAYPSKLMTYLRAGCRVAVVAEPDSELARTVVENGLGISSPPGDAETLAKAVLAEMRRSRSGRDRERIADFARRTYGSDAVLESWAELLVSLGAEVEVDTERERSRSWGVGR